MFEKEMFFTKDGETWRSSYKRAIDLLVDEHRNNGLVEANAELVKSVFDLEGKLPCDFGIILGDISRELSPKRTDFVDGEELEIPF